MAFILGACSQASGPDPVFHAEGKPERLSEWGQMRSDGTLLRQADSSVTYDLNSPLFSDYALKWRTVSLPKGVTADYHPNDVFDFPVGTVITKTFYYPTGDTPNSVQKALNVPMPQGKTLSLKGHRLIETRILAHREEGWVALPYVWNAEQTDAVLKRTGDIQKLSLVDDDQTHDFAYIVPNENQCAGCHATNNTTRRLSPIGPKARHLNRTVTYETGSANQLDYWTSHGLLTGLPDKPSANADYRDMTADLDARARAYLDINCSHCHSRVGPADTSGLHLEPDTPVGQKLGLCKPPIAAGTGTGDRRYGIVPGKPDASIFTYRMETTDPGAMMPELGRSLSHTEGVALIKDWIKALEGECKT